MSVQTELDRIINAVDAAHLKVAEKGGTTARPFLVGNLASAIDSIPEATEPTLQSKTVSPATSSQTVKPDNGYDGLSQVTVNAMPAATQATPSISVSSGGLITASSTQSAGYVAAGTKSATKQLTTQGAQTITPGTSNKTIASGRYLTGTQTIKGDANLKAANIAKGVSIFGVTGTHEGGEDISAETAEYTEQLDELEDVIDGLPNAGGGGSVETCTLTMHVSPCGFTTTGIYMTSENGIPSMAHVPLFLEELETLTLTVVKGSVLYLFGTDSDMADVEFSANCEIVLSEYDGNDCFYCLGIKINGDATIYPF
jgi:hypothetical protein